MEEKRNKPSVIVISDDEDEENTPSNLNLPGKDKLEKPNLHKRVISIVISDEDDETCLPLAAHAQNSSCQVSSSTNEVLSPWKNLRVNEKNIRRLKDLVKPLVKLKKLDLGNATTRSAAGKFNTGDKDEVDNKFDKPSSCSSDDRHSKIQVKVEKDDSKVNCQPTRTSMGIFEAMEKKLSSVKQEKMDTNGLLHNKEQKNFSRKNNYYQDSTSGNKRPKSPPSSPSLRQSKLTEERFSPKKRPSVMYGCPRQEQAFHYDTPLYCAVPLRKSLNSADPSLSKNFSETQMNSLQALKEENFHQSVLTTIASFMSQHRKPPLSLVFYLLKDILLAKQSNCGTACFRILRQIQVLHPAVPAQMISQKITWEFIAMIVKLSKCTDNKFQSGGDSGLAVNASLALSFIISVMEEEVKMKTFSHVKTSAYRLLFVVKHASHIHDVAEWIGEAVKQHRVEQYDHGCGHNVCPVYLLQRILMLSLLVSERPEDCASRIADEMILVYSQMPSIELKTLFLQSMQSYLLRARLIEMVVGNCCPLAQIEQGNDGIPSGGLRHIIFVDFKRSPPAFNDDVMSSSDKVDYIASCEEFLMLLAYWLQSLIFCRKKSLQKNTSDSLRILSMDDIDVMMDIDQELVKLRERLENLCSPTELSPRSYKLLELMRSLKSFVQKLP